MDREDLLPYKERIDNTYSFLFDAITTGSALAVIFWFISLPFKIELIYYIFPYGALFNLLILGPTTTPSFKLGVVELKIIKYLKCAKELFKITGSLLFLILFINYYLKFSNFLYFKSLDFLEILERSLNLFFIVFFSSLIIALFSFSIIPGTIAKLFKNIKKQRFLAIFSISISLLILYTCGWFLISNFLLMEKMIPIFGFSLIYIHLNYLTKLTKKIFAF